ncbi:MAG: hypothetical protein DRQ55_10410 [Planctomycetota bacterium]|nr:MAG: hypothetical protein DRQ55_10410 [Planctomycetota bacterium]
MKPLLLSFALCSLVASSVTAQAPWHLDRVDQRSPFLDCSYDPVAEGGGVTVYVVSTGIAINLPEFSGRAAEGFIAPGLLPGDQNGNGTWLASIVAGETYGVDEDASLVSVKVINPQGSASYGDIFAGLGWIDDELQAHPATRAVVLLGFGPGNDTQLLNAVDSLIASGATVVAPAGNSDDDACSSHPWTPATLVVGGTDRYDTRAFFSGYGPCLDLFAPGVDVQGADPSGGSVTQSGTGAAAAMVAGAASLYMGSLPGASTPAAVANYLLSGATEDAISDIAGSPNLLLYVQGVPPAVPCPPVAPPAPWHLDRIDQWNLPLDCSYDPVAVGFGTTVYVVSTGIDPYHPELFPRVSLGYTAPGLAPGDQNGSGTWLASIVAGETYGVDGTAQVVDVKVLNGSGGGPSSDIVAGLWWVYSDAQAHSGSAVVLLGVADYFDSSMGAAVQALNQAGVTVVVPAGNGDGDACSLAIAPEAIVVGATDRCDKRANFSNYGYCLDLFAPGLDVEGAWPGDGSKVLSNTTASAAMVAGAASVYMGAYPAGRTPAQVANHLAANGAQGVIDFSDDPLGAASPNLLLHVNGTPSPTPCTPEPCAPSTASINGVFSFGGGGDGTPWSWKIVFPFQPALDTGVHTNAGVTGTVLDVAVELAKAINETFAAMGLDAPDAGIQANFVKSCASLPLPAHDYQAIVTDCSPGSVMMEVRAPQAFKLYVGDGAIPSCEVVETGPACEFNPYMWELPTTGLDCNQNGQDDTLDINTGASQDSNGDGIPDECQGSPWTNQGYALAGVSGDPLLLGFGDLTPGSSYSLELSNAAPLVGSALFWNLESAPVSFRGGTVVPGVDHVVYPITTNAAGEITLSVLLPAVPMGTEMWYQWLIPDTAAVRKVAMSNAIMGVTP